ncbi:MAG: hypothetical protein GX221_08805 [Candidatus Riflebacteria bacterium]|nr:hypothetical protein [Candidatus Riflebacteria bacterium]
MQVDSLLLKSQFVKAEKLILKTIKQEKKKSKQELTENIAWMTYRLGILNELKGKAYDAERYFSGGKDFSKGFGDYPLIAFYASEGTVALFKEGSPRNFQDILNFEAMNRELLPPEEEVQEEKTPKKKSQKKPTFVPFRPRSTEGLQLIDDGAYNPPDLADPPAFQVWH